MSKLVISQGGQVYDRTTGTWAGENTGNIGDDRSAPGREGRAIHDANGLVGIQLAPPVNRPGAGRVQTGPGGGGSGPGSAAVASRPGQSPAGSGPGSPVVGVVGGPYKPGFSPGLIDWQTPTAFSQAPEIDGLENAPLKRIGVGGHNEAPGAVSDIGWARTSTGYVPVPASDMKERIEDNFFMETSWFVRNYVTPMFVSGQEKAPAFMNPEYSHYVPILNEWREGTLGTRPPGGNVRTHGGF